MHKDVIVKSISNNLDKLVFIFFLLFSFFTIEEFGISWDENIQKNLGYVNFDYIFYDNDTLLSLADKDYGAFFELVLVLFEKLFSIEDLRDVFLLRHFLTHLFFLVSAHYLYRLIFFLYNNKTVALIGMLFLLLTPRIYAHSFFNTKDLPFLSMLIICFYYKAVAFEKKTIVNFLRLGLTIGFLISIRIMGVMLLLIVPIFLFIDALHTKKYKFHFWRSTAFIAATSCALYVSWPYLWESPMHNFTEAFSNMSKFRYVGTLLFDGEIISAAEVGWNYIPIWFSITTPLSYLCIGTLGLICFSLKIIRNPKRYLLDVRKRNLLSYFTVFIGSILIVILLKSVLYDGWRQMYFIYPAFILITISFIHQIKSAIIKQGILIIMAGTFIFELGFIALNTTQSSVYFNSILSHKQGDYLSKNYEMDYWGNTYKKTLEILAKKVEEDTIDIYITNPPGKMNVMFLREEDRGRFKIKEKGEATFLITNYRYKQINYEELEDKEYFSLVYGGNKICTVFRLNNDK